MKNLLFLLYLLAQTVSAQFTNISIVKEVKAKKKGLVVSAHPLASEAGAQILKKEEMPLTLRDCYAICFGSCLSTSWKY